VRGGRAAITLRSEDVGPETVAAAVQGLLDEPSFTAAARVVRNEIEVMPDADTVLATLTAP
jgi:hypothetical protein